MPERAGQHRPTRSKSPAMANAPGQGRKPQPTALKILRGNPGRRPLPTSEPKPPLAIPRPPSHLDKAAKAEWRRIGRKLLEQGIVTELDGSALGVYCVAYSRWKDAEEHLAQYGTVIKTPTGFL